MSQGTVAPEQKIEDVGKSARQATVLVVVY